jgi:hypothetical protein
VLRDAPPKRNNRAFSTLPNCSSYVVNLPPDPPATTLYFYDSYLNRVNVPNLHKYIRFAHNNLRGFGPLRGLDKISPETRFCTNFGAMRSETPHNSTSVIPSGVEEPCVRSGQRGPRFSGGARLQSGRRRRTERPNPAPEGRPTIAQDVVQERQSWTKSWVIRIRVRAEKDSGIANPPDRANSRTPAHSSFSNRSAALSTISQKMESFSILTSP